MRSPTPIRRRAGATLVAGAMLGGTLAVMAPAAGAALVDRTVPISCSPTGPITQQGDATNPLSDPPGKLVSEDVAEGLETNPIPIDLDLSVDAPGVISVDDPIAYGISLNQNFDVLAQDAFEDQIAPTFDALAPGASADVELNLYITDLTVELPLPAGTTIVDGSLDVSVPVGDNPPTVEANLVGDTIVVTFSPIAANGDGGGPNVKNRTAPGASGAFEAFLLFEVDTTGVPFGTVVDLLPGDVSFDFAPWIWPENDTDYQMGGFNISFPDAFVGLLGGINAGASGPFGCTPVNPTTPIISTGVGTFPDVPESHPFFDEIVWLVTQGITTGYPDDTFRPAAPVTRQAMAAFVYRYENRTEGSFVPAPGLCTEAPFTDIPTDHPFCGEIQWMKQAQLTSGYADGTFRPTASISRQAMAAFLYRLSVVDHEEHDHGHGAAMNEVPTPDPCTEAPFTDVFVSNPFCGEILWLVDAGITTGFNDGTFRPTAAVSRQAMAAFLYRFDLFTNAGPGSIIDVATEAGAFTTLLDLLATAGLTSVLDESPGPLTVFAPTDAAFALIDPATLAALEADIPALTDVLNYHVVVGQFLAADLLAMNGETLDTLSGDTLLVEVEGTTVSLVDGTSNTVVVIDADIMASNGVIHVVGEVLFPPAP